jgi:outer membrane protein assembly factor BamB
MKITVCLILVAASAQLRAANWPNWRGPNFDGSSAEKNLPASFSKTQNVKWRASLAGPSAATPIVWGEKVFLSSTDEKNKTLRALCLDRNSGKTLWDMETAAGYNLDEKSNLASPSPATDGKTVVFLYGNGILAGFDFEGKKLWSHDLQKEYGTFAYQWTYGASPLIYEDRLYVQVLQRNEPVHGRGKADGESYILALDPASGKVLWKHVRASDAKMESREAYSTPIPFLNNGRKEILIAGGDCISGHDPESGGELWRWGTWNPTRITHWRLVPSPVAGGGVILACAPKGSPIYAFKVGLRGTQTDSAIAWKTEEREVSSDVGTPLFYQGRFYVLNGDRKTIARVDPASGRADWIGELGTRVKLESSPTAGDGKIYFQDFKGQVFVVQAGEKFNLLKTIAMGDEGDDQLRSSIAIADGHLYLRTGHTLYCLGAQ